MSKKILIDLNETLLQFTPAIWGGSDLNEAQSARLAEKLVKLLVQRCREIDVIEFKALVYRGGTSGVVRLTIPANVRAELIAGERIQVLVVKPKKSEVKDE